MLKIIATLLIFALPVVSCSKEGEKFDIGMHYDNYNNPSLKRATLSMKDFHANESFDMVRASVSLHSIKIPETVELSWQAENEPNSHTKTLPIRPQIPKWVLNKLAIESPRHKIDINFFIINNQPFFCWQLFSSSNDYNMPAKTIANGENCPWLQK